MRCAPLIATLALLAGCAPDVEQRTRCTVDAQCFLGERCADGLCVSASVGAQDAAGADATLSDGSAPDGGGDARADVAPSDSQESPTDSVQGGADTAPDAGAPDTGAPDTGAPDIGDGADATDAGTVTHKVVVTAKLTDVTADKDTFVDIGFCPSHSSVASSGSLAGASSCDDAVFVRAKGASGGGLVLQALTTRSGATLQSSTTISSAKGGTVTVTLQTEALPGDPTALVPVKVLVATDGGASLDWDTTTETRWLDRFGAFNLQAELIGTCLLSATFDGTMSNVQVSVDEAKSGLQTLAAGATRQGTWKDGGAWVQFTVDACAADYYLMNVEFP